jgi:hypothetical protein
VNAFDYSFLRVIRFCFSVLSRTWALIVKCLILLGFKNWYN